MHKVCEPRRKPRLVCLLVAALTILVAEHGHSLPWNTDMYGQPELAVGTAPKPPPAHSVPTTGAEPPMSSRMSARIRAGLRLSNPNPASAESLASGKALFQIYCTACHGPQGRGDGPVVGKGIPSSDLHTARIKGQKDGYMYATIRSGGIIMPSYGYALSVAERWDIVNYLRHLQGPMSRTHLINRKGVTFAQDRRPLERLSDIYEIASSNE